MSADGSPGEEGLKRASTTRPAVRWKRLTLVACAAAYLALLAARSATSASTSDEALVANPAYNLATSGYMGTTNVDDPEWPDVGRYTFNTLPGGILAVALLFKLAGCSLFAARIPSMIFAILMLLAVYHVALWLTGARNAAILSVALVAIDYNFISSATSGRVDMMAASLGFLAQATYLSLRKQSLDAAFLTGSICIVAAGLTHPAAILFAACLATLILNLDRNRIRPRHLLLAVAPLAIGFAAWFSYYHLKPESAWAQLNYNFNAHQPEFGFKALALTALREIPFRYMHFYGRRISFGRSFIVNVLVTLYYGSCLATAAVWSRARNSRAAKLLVGETLLIAGYLALMEPAKFPAYLIYVVPFYGILGAYFICEIWPQPGRLKRAAAALLLLVSSAGLSIILRDIRLDGYHRQDVPAAQFLIKVARPRDLVLAPPAWGFSYGFDRNAVRAFHFGFTRDPVFIVTQGDLDSMLTSFRRRMPDHYDDAKNLLARFHRVYTSQTWSIYQQGD